MTNTDEIAILRIELEGIEPLIWRRVSVRTVVSLTELHHVIQAVMGWLNCHLWAFEADNRRFSMRVPSEPEWNERYENSETTTLEMLLQAGLRRMEYVYDMGDYWEHRVIVERLTVPLSEVRYPQFLGGERRCPPEDCGGVPGYYEFMKNVTSKRKDKRAHALAWYGGPYDADNIGEQTIGKTPASMIIAASVPSNCFS
jgi:Plasmid pRiA4b ORF-3-like protein